MRVASFFKNMNGWLNIQRAKDAYSIGLDPLLKFSSNSCM
jgi:hypothetical protein